MNADHAALSNPSARLIAHRGYPTQFPENSLAGIRASIAAGARFIEVDVQLSRDGVPVLFHDRQLRRLCGVSGSIAQYRESELRAMRLANSALPIATLAELRQLASSNPHVRFFIELKRIAIAHFGAESVWHKVELELRPLRTQCVIISFDTDILHLAQADGWALGVVIERWNERRKPDVTALGPAFLFIDADRLPARGQVRLHECALVVYDVVDPSKALELMRRGVELVETFAIADMLRAIKKD